MGFNIFGEVKKKIGVEHFLRLTLFCLTNLESTIIGVQILGGSAFFRGQHFRKVNIVWCPIFGVFKIVLYPKSPLWDTGSCDG